MRWRPRNHAQGVSRISRLILLAIAVVLPAGIALAHDFWIEPSSFAPGAGAAIAIDLKVGEDFIGDSVPRRAGATDLFALYTGADSPRPISGADGLSPAGMIAVDGKRTSLVAYSGTGGTVTLPAGRFERYLESHGLELVIRDRATRNETLEPGREKFYRHAKTLMSGAATDPALGGKVLGQALEILVDGDPTQATALTVTGQILWQGTPLAGGLLIARNGTDPGQPLKTRTGPDGRFSLSLQGGDIWLLQIVWMERAGWFSAEDWQSHWSSLTFRKPRM